MATKNVGDPILAGVNSEKGIIINNALFLTPDGGTIGYAHQEAAPSSPFSSDKHFQEIGHILEATAGAGLAMCVLHSN
jgi:hypothetical protein